VRAVCARCRSRRTLCFPEDFENVFPCGSRQHLTRMTRITTDEHGSFDYYFVHPSYSALDPKHPVVLSGGNVRAVCARCRSRRTLCFPTDSSTTCLREDFEIAYLRGLHNTNPILVAFIATIQGPEARMPNVSPARKGWVSEHRIRAPEARHQTICHVHCSSFEPTIAGTSSISSFSKQKTTLPLFEHRNNPRAGGANDKRKPSPEGMVSERRIFQLPTS
jgi:hypothetical protein